MMKNNRYYAVIMAGGIGSRFWPVSTTAFPKQFHDMLGTGESLLQKTFNRLTGLVPKQQIKILTHQNYASLCLNQLPEIKEDQVYLEPAMRNTAPCILLSALKIYKENPDALMLVAPSDHWIENETSFCKDVELCFQACSERDLLMTLGIEPTFPNTGYGYIESDPNSNDQIKEVLQFREKPDYETAKAFLKSGNFYWNAGIFIWSVKSILSAFQKWQPEMYTLLHNGMEHLNTPKEQEFVNKYYPMAENISIDYGIMEKAANVYVKKAQFDWNDLGTWGALHEKLPKDENQNAVVRGVSDFTEASNNMVFTNKEKLVVLDGIKDYIIVDKEEVLLIYPKDKEQDIKKLLTKISDKYGKKYT